MAKTFSMLSPLLMRWNLSIVIQGKEILIYLEPFFSACTIWVPCCPSLKQSLSTIILFVLMQWFGLVDKIEKAKTLCNLVHIENIQISWFIEEHDENVVCETNFSKRNGLIAKQSQRLLWTEPSNTRFNPQQRLKFYRWKNFTGIEKRKKSKLRKGIKYTCTTTKTD